MFNHMRDHDEGIRVDHAPQAEAHLVATLDLGRWSLVKIDARSAWCGHDDLQHIFLGSLVVAEMVYEGTGQAELR